MIGQRLAVWGSAALPATQHRKRTQKQTGTNREVTQAAAGRTNLGLAPARSLAAFLGRSVLLQLMLAMALISFAAVIYLNQASKESVVQFNITDLQREQIQLNLRNANLYATATSLQSLGRIETLASTQLHMTQPSQNNVTWIRPVIPRVAPVPVDMPAASAEQQSQPLAWMQHALQFMAAAL